MEINSHVFLDRYVFYSIKMNIKDRTTYRMCKYYIWWNQFKWVSRYTVYPFTLFLTFISIWRIFFVWKSRDLYTNSKLHITHVLQCTTFHDMSFTTPYTPHLFMQVWCKRRDYIDLILGSSDSNPHFYIVLPRTCHNKKAGVGVRGISDLFRPCLLTLAKFF